MGKLSNYKSDLGRESEGVWVDFGDGIRLKIARLGNPAYQKMVDRLMKPELKRLRLSKDQARNDEVITKITAQALAKHILVGWENIQDEKGKEIPYSSEQALEYLQDLAYRDFYNFVLVTANDAELYRTEVLEDSKGN